MAVDGAGVFTVGKRKLLPGLVIKSILMFVRNIYFKG